jgi:RND superfamily putative drug exporter
LLVAVKLGSPAQPASSGSGTAKSSSAGGASATTTDPRASDPRLQKLYKEVASTKGIAGVSPIQIDPAGTTAYFSAISKTNPADTSTTGAVTSIRNSAIPTAEKGTNLKAYVGGTTAAYEDLAAKISSKLPLQILVVIALSFILLIVAFRTVVVPPQAAVMNLLSIGASYGVLTAIFQFGWLSSVMGLSGGVPIVSYVPLFMFAILFGLSMDYEVFLVSRVREEWVRRRDARLAVADGIAFTGRVISAAAAIMICVFLSFMLGDERAVKEFGFGLAMAVFLDALVIRCVLLPAVLEILGSVTWKLPAWIDSRLPHFNIEGSSGTMPRPYAEDERAEEPELEQVRR